MCEESHEQWEERLLREISSVGPENNELIGRRVKMLSDLGVETWRCVERQLAYYFESEVLSEQEAVDTTETCIVEQLATYRKRTK